MLQKLEDIPIFSQTFEELKKYQAKVQDLTIYCETLEALNNTPNANTHTHLNNFLMVLMSS